MRGIYGRSLVAGIALAMVVGGCGSHRNSLLLERQARGPLDEEKDIARSIAWVFEPTTQTKSEHDLEATMTYADAAFQKRFFDNPRIFGHNSGKNPFFPEHVVFYVRLVNKSPKKVKINPDEFVMLDDLGNQYATINADYINALAESKAPISSMTRGVLEDAHPGYFGFGLPMGKLMGKVTWRFILLKIANLQPGYLYSGVVYDGLIAFWNPHEDAKNLKVVLANIKTDFKPDDFPATAFDVTFDLTASRQRQASPPK